MKAYDNMVILLRCTRAYQSMTPRPSHRYRPPPSVLQTCMHQALQMVVIWLERTGQYSEATALHLRMFQCETSFGLSSLSCLPCAAELPAKAF